MTCSYVPLEYSTKRRPNRPVCWFLHVPLIWSAIDEAGDFWKLQCRLAGLKHNWGHWTFTTTSLLYIWIIFSTCGPRIDLDNRRPTPWIAFDRLSWSWCPAKEGKTSVPPNIKPAAAKHMAAMRCATPCTSHSSHFPPFSQQYPLLCESSDFSCKLVSEQPRTGSSAAKCDLTNTLRRNVAKH